MLKDLVFCHTSQDFHRTTHLMRLHHFLTTRRTIISLPLTSTVMCLLLLFMDLGLKHPYLLRPYLLLDLPNRLCYPELYYLLNFAIIKKLMMKIKHALPNFAFCLAIGALKNWNVRTGMTTLDLKGSLGKTFLINIVSFFVM